MAGYMATSKTCEWGTPRDLFIELDEEFSFDLDPASSHSNAKCERHYTVEEDGLAQPWDGSVFVNPPYGAVIAQWIDKAIQESHRCTRIVMLLPARTDTRWFHRLLDIGAEVRFVRGRLKFESEGGGGRRLRPRSPVSSSFCPNRSTADDKPLWTDGIMEGVLMDDDQTSIRDFEAEFGIQGGGA